MHRQSHPDLPFRHLGYEKIGEIELNLDHRHNPALG